ncbi:MAG: response regulator [Leptolyngbyaceae cyanobacterium bins.59]|nr:response regulator [Leptolyngbyaceae cyanobacterium bins.59]
MLNAIHEISILIVDDQPDNLRTLSAILSREGYSVRRSSSGQMALETTRFSPPDLILLDIRMPLMDGYEVCNLLRAMPESQDIPVIFLSALDDTLDKVKAFEVGGSDYIVKPFQVQEVLARVRHQLTIRQQKKQLLQQNEALQQAIREQLKAEEALQHRMMLTELIASVTHQIRRSLELDEILSTAVGEVRRVVQADRLLVQQFQSDRSLRVVAESVNLEDGSLLGQVTELANQEEAWHLFFQNNGVHVVEDRPILQTTLPIQDWVAKLEAMEEQEPSTPNVRACLTVPLWQGEDLWGLLTAQQFMGPYPWHEWEMTLLQQVANQLAIAIQQASLYLQVKCMNQQLHNALEPNPSFQPVS